MRSVLLSFLIFQTFIGASSASTQLPGPLQSAAFMEMIATRGAECGLLKPWQASALRALVLRDAERWTADRKARLPGAATALIETTECSNESMRIWIEASSRGFESEMLAPYLVVYRYMAQQETKPPQFTATATRIRFGPAITAIDRKLNELEASGAVPEGGKPWPVYIERTEVAAEEFISLLSDPEADPAQREEAMRMMSQTAHIVELWLLDQD